jgi:lipid-binding SYLF domain-containing protein
MTRRSMWSAGSRSASDRVARRPRAAALLPLLFAGACVSVPGDEAAEKRKHVDAYAEESLELLVKQSPEVKAELDAAKGYAVIQKSGVKIPVFGAESGWGVVVERDSGKRTYVKMRGVEFGAGWGARVSRVIAILHTPEEVAAARDGGFEFRAGAEAGAKAGDVGGGAGGGVRSDSGPSVYVLLDSGAAATATVGVLRTSHYDALNEPAEAK